MVDGKNCADKEQMFLANKDGNEEGKHIYYPNVEQLNFGKIPGAPIGYWVSENGINNWTRANIPFSKYGEARVGLDTGNNDKYLRFFYEIDYKYIKFNATSQKELSESLSKYVPTTKGGTIRKWYGNLEYVIKFDNNSYNELLNSGNHLPSRQYYFRRHLLE